MKLGIFLPNWVGDVVMSTPALRALRQTPAIADISLIDGQGRERVAESRLALGRVGSMADRMASPAFSGARQARGAYYGDVSFRKGSEPFMTVAVAGPRGEAGVAIAEVSLKYIWDVVSEIRIGDVVRAMESMAIEIEGDGVAKAAA